MPEHKAIIRWNRSGPDFLKGEEQLHHRAHEECFIANSIKTEVRIQTP
jgi:organic hydroperoxide reductase OsmC/OhrA